MAVVLEFHSPFQGCTWLFSGLECNLNKVINLNTSAIEISVLKQTYHLMVTPLRFCWWVLALFIHPYILTIVAEVFQLWLKIKPRFFLAVYAISFAVFWSSRNYVVLGDDAIKYINQFQMMQDNDVALLVRNYIRKSRSTLALRLVI